MNGTIVLIAIFVLLIGGFYLLNRFYRNRTIVEDHHDHESDDGVCCGRHSNCSKGYDSENLYFDDEELDAHKGKKQEEYSESDIEEFRNVLYTMNIDEVDTWAKCLETRGIEIPQEIKNEILLMLQ